LDKQIVQRYHLFSHTNEPISSFLLQFRNQGQAARSQPDYSFSVFARLKKHHFRQRFTIGINLGYVSVIPSTNILLPGDKPVLDHFTEK
jgi:hypothetical protein